MPSSSAGPRPATSSRTPNIDRVAREGVLFRNAFVNAPSCTPCRSSILSGRYFFRTGRGAILQGAVWDAAIPSWPAAARARPATSSASRSRSGARARRPTRLSAATSSPTRRPATSSIASPNNATSMVKDGMTFDAARARMLAEVRGNFQAFLKERPKDQPFCYWFGPTLTHRSWAKGLRQGPVGHRSRVAQGQAAQVPARRARDP